jgi:hypothetical protein
MNYKIQPLGDEITQLCELNKSSIDQWYRIVDDEAEPVDWHDLDPSERFAHGGQWLDPKLLEIHVKRFQKFGAIDVLKIPETDDIIAEIEYHSFGNGTHIDWLFIHPKYRTPDILKQLIDHMQLNSKQDLWIEPDDEDVEQLYLNQGFIEVEPSYYFSEKRGQAAEIQNWEEYTPDFGLKSFNYGLGWNSPQSQKHSLDITCEIAKVINQQKPVLVRTEVINGIEVTYFKKRSLAVPQKHNLTVSSETEIDVVTVINEGLKFCMRTEMIGVVMLGNSLGWSNPFITKNFKLPKN